MIMVDKGLNFSKIQEIGNWPLTVLPVAVCIPVRNKSSPKERAMHRLRWTKLWSFCINSFLYR